MNNNYENFFEFALNVTERAMMDSVCKLKSCPYKNSIDDDDGTHISCAICKQTAKEFFKDEGSLFARIADALKQNTEDLEEELWDRWRRKEERRWITGNKLSI